MLVKGEESPLAVLGSRISWPRLVKVQQAAACHNLEMWRYFMCMRGHQVQNRPPHRSSKRTCPTLVGSPMTQKENCQFRSQDSAQCCRINAALDHSGPSFSL